MYVRPRLCIYKHTGCTKNRVRTRVRMCLLILEKINLLKREKRKYSRANSQEKLCI